VSIIHLPSKAPNTRKEKEAIRNYRHIKNVRVRDRRRWEDNFKINLIETGRNYVVGIIWLTTEKTGKLLCTW
jgi:hypothetical protein